MPVIRRLFLLKWLLYNQFDFLRLVHMNHVYCFIFMKHVIKNIITYIMIECVVIGRFIG